MRSRRRNERQRQSHLFLRHAAQAATSDRRATHRLPTFETGNAPSRASRRNVRRPSPDERASIHSSRALSFCRAAMTAFGAHGGQRRRNGGPPCDARLGRMGARTNTANQGSNACHMRGGTDLGETPPQKSQRHAAAERHPVERYSTRIPPWAPIGASALGRGTDGGTGAPAPQPAEFVLPRCIGVTG